MVPSIVQHSPSNDMGSCKAFCLETIGLVHFNIFKTKEKYAGPEEAQLHLSCKREDWGSDPQNLCKC